MEKKRTHKLAGEPPQTTTLNMAYWVSNTVYQYNM